MGDIVLALPALSALRRNFPDAKISWLVRSEFAPLLKGHPHLDEIILFDRRFLGKAWVNPRAFVALSSLIRKLRSSEFDLVIDLQGLLRTALLSFLSGCKRRFGMANAREFAYIFYTDKIKQDRDSIHLVDYYLNIVKAAGVSLRQAQGGKQNQTIDTSVQFILPQTGAADNSIADLLKSSNVNRSNYAVFVPGSAHDDKRWPAECFAELAGKVSSQFGFSIVAVGTAAEKDIVEQIKNLTNVPITNLAGVTNISELISLLRTAELVVSNDTGPGHIAAALGVPIVMIFGRSNPARVAPYGRNYCVAAVEPDGRGFKADSTNPRHNIKFVTVNEVYRLVCQQLRP